MDFLNIVFGLGGTGLEIAHDFLKIKNRHPVNDKNDIECFILDTRPPEDQADFSNFGNNINDKLIEFETFNNSNEIVEQIKSVYNETNIDEIFPNGGRIRQDEDSNDTGAWIKRKLGYLSLLNHLRYNYGIIEKLSSVLKNRKAFNYKKINFFFICSIAGGTGSGILLPLNIVVKNFMDKNYKNCNVTYNHLLATPEAVAQGSRDPDDESIEAHFKANAYQSLKEIDIISKLKPGDDFNWEVKITDDKKIEYNRSMGILVNNVFLFNNSNLENRELASSARDEDAYKPTFHLMAWSLFLLNSIDNTMWGDIGNVLNANARKPFSGMGVYVLEYPQNDILSKCAHILLKNIDENLANFRNISSNEIENRIETFKLPVEKFEESANSPEMVDENLVEYSRQINRYTEKSQKSTLISLEPQITLPSVDKYTNEFREKLNESIDNMLKTDMLTVEDVKVYLKRLKSKIIKKKNTLKKNINRKESIIENLNSQLNNIRSIGNIKRLKTGKCFRNKYDLKLYENAIELLEKNKNYLSKLINYLHKIYEEFETSNFIENSEYFKEQDPYFKYLPLEKTYENLDNISSNIMQKIYDTYRKEHLASHNIELREDELNQKILKDFWVYFSDKYNKNFADLIDNYIKTGKDKINKRLLVRKYEEYLIEFLRKEGDLIEKNNIIEKINDGSINKNKSLKYTYPYINIEDMAISPGGKKFIACNKNNEKNIDTAKLEEFRGTKKYPAFQDDNIVIFCYFSNKLELSRLEISDYELKYNRRLKNNEKWYRFIDPCFEEFEDRQ